MAKSTPIVLLINRGNQTSPELNKEFKINVQSSFFKLRLMLIDKEGRIAHESTIIKFSRLLFFTKFLINPVIGNSITIPEHRGKGLYSYAISLLIKEHFSKSKKSIYAFVAPDNEVPLRNLPKLGFERIEEFRFKKIGPLYFKSTD